MTRHKRQFVAAVAAALVAATLSGCISLPTSGRVSNSGSAGSSGSQQLIQLVPRPPGAGWVPEDIVWGFLAAIGSSLSTPGQSRSSALAVPRDYLAPGYRPDWQPDLRSPTVIDSSLADLTIVAHQIPARVVGGPNTSVVQVTSDHVEALQSGNNVISTQKHVFQFTVIDTAGGYRIARIGSQQISKLLLLTQPDFERDYQPRTLYFLADGRSRVLVPCPVFISQQAQPQGSAQFLVEHLLSTSSSCAAAGPGGWLNNTTSTAFPPGAKVVSVQVSGIKAIVTLDLPDPSRLTHARLRKMEAQLVWTLTSSQVPGAGLGIGSVQLVVRNGPTALILPSDFASWVPSVSGRQLYYQALSGTGRPVIRAIGARSPVLAPQGLGAGPFTAIAAAPSGFGLTMLAACRGPSLYLALAGSHGRVITRRLSAPCTSLSWDPNGNLWVTVAKYIDNPGNPIGGDNTPPGGPAKTQANVYLVHAISDGALVRKPQVTAVLNGGLNPSASYRVNSLSVAPDGVRAAMIVQFKSGSSELLVMGISHAAPYVYLAQSGASVEVGSDISNPMALSWQDPNDLLALGAPAGLGSPGYLFKVPLNGEPSAQSAFQAPAGAAWLAVGTPGVAIGTTEGPQGRIWYSRNWSGPWPRSLSGRSPAYPG